MARASYTQSGFLGGLWSPLSQGRFDQPFYHQALSVNLNAIITEEGPWVRRSGSQMIGPTHLRGPAKLLPFQSTAAHPYLMEFTDNNLRFWLNTGPICTNDRQVITASSSSAGVLSLTTTTAHGWEVGDHIIIFTPNTIAPDNIAAVQNRHLKIMSENGTTGLTAADDVGIALPTDIGNNGLNDATAIRINRLGGTGITAAMLPAVRAIQAQTHAVILSGTAPSLVTVTTDLVAGSDTDPVMSFDAADFVDGPYLDPQPDTATVNAYTGAITVTPATTVPVAADVGRCIRLFSQPALYSAATTYSTGDRVTDSEGAWWVWTYSSGLAGVDPGTSTTVGGVTYLPWAPAPGAGVWAWGTITSQDATTYSVTLTTDLDGTNGTTISSWQLGVYMAGQYPTCGVYHEGRLWLAGAIPNRFDASMSNELLTFSPTDVNGNVLDNSAISVTLNFDDLSDIFWMVPDHQGIVVGTNGGEILIAASQLSDPITPTSIQAHRVSKYMVANVEARRTGLAVLFVQRYQQRVMEHMADAFSGKFSGRHLNEFAKSFAATGVKELAYQEEKVPIVWALMNDGTLAGCSYRRVSRFTAEPPVMEAWQQIALGDNSTINSICTLPGTSGLSDMLYLNPVDANGEYWIDVLRPLFEDA